MPAVAASVVHPRRGHAVRSAVLGALAMAIIAIVLSGALGTPRALGEPPAEGAAAR